jgi:hypothetical protein
MMIVIVMMTTHDVATDLLERTPLFHVRSNQPPVCGPDPRFVQETSEKSCRIRADICGCQALHHGTLLIDVEMTALAGLLNPNKLKLQVRSQSNSDLKSAPTHTTTILLEVGIINPISRVPYAHYRAPTLRTDESFQEM